MFAGLVTYKNAPPNPEWASIGDLRRALYPRFQPDITGHYQTSSELLVSGEIYNTPCSHHLTASPLVVGSIALSFWGRLDNREDLAHRLGITKTLSQTTDHELVLAGWQKWGEALPEHLDGDFAIAILDSNRHLAFLARDKLGIKPIYYWPRANGCIFANSLACFRILKQHRPTPDPVWMAKHFLRMAPSHDTTGFKEILKIPPGHCLTVCEGSARLSRYHQWQNNAGESKTRDPELLENYKSLLEDTINNQMISDYPLGVESSGGIDSTTIMAYIARALGDDKNRIHALGGAFLEKEPEYVLQTSQVYGLRNNYIVTDPSQDIYDDSDVCKAHIDAVGIPSEFLGTLTTTPYLEYCQKNGIRTLFSGFGGDEVVTNYGWGIEDKLWQKGRYLTALSVAHRPFHFIKSKALAPLLPQSNRNEKILSHALRVPRDIGRTLFNPGLFEEYGLENFIVSRANTIGSFDTHNDWILNHLLGGPHFSSRFEHSTLLAATYGVEYRWPLADARLIQFYLSSPIIERIGPAGMGRYLHRRAVDGVVPKKIAWKLYKSMGSPAYDMVFDSKKVIGAMKDVDQYLDGELGQVVSRDRWKSEIGRLENEPENQVNLKKCLKRSRTIRQIGLWLEGPERTAS